jgi:hypothetical protein
VETFLYLIVAAVGVFLLLTGLVYVGSARKSKRYRPGRPFSFTPVWFVAAPERQARAGVVAGTDVATRSSGAVARPVRPRETGGASDRW